MVELLDENKKVFDRQSSKGNQLKWERDDVWYIANAKSKTISESFDEQLDASEKLYGQNISFHFNKKDVENIVDSAIIYTEETRQRVKNIIFEQMRKYEYLFSD